MDSENILVVGVPAEALGKAELSAAEHQDALLYLRVFAGLCEVCLLWTGGQVEAVAAAKDIQQAEQRIKDWFLKRGGAALSASLYSFTGYDAVHHLFRAACGLNASAAGNSETLKQFERGYLFALERGLTGGLLNRLLQKAAAAGKRRQLAEEPGQSEVFASLAAEACRDQLDRPMAVSLQLKRSEAHP